MYVDAIFDVVAAADEHLELKSVSAADVLSNTAVTPAVSVLGSADSAAAAAATAAAAAAVTNAAGSAGDVATAASSAATCRLDPAAAAGCTKDSASFAVAASVDDRVVAAATGGCDVAAVGVTRNAAARCPACIMVVG